jgi:hypothetical protein
MTRPWPALSLTLVLFFGITAAAPARPAHKRALADYFGPFLASKLNDCRTCHLPEPPGTANDPLVDKKPHNAFGARLKEVRKELRKAGKKTDIPSRLEYIADEDSDGDGVSNLIELLSGHFPGDPADKPSAAEITEARKTLVAFRKAKAAYPWTPFEAVQRPRIPRAKNAEWVQNPIDAFLAAEHEAHGLQPRPPVAKHILLRRLYLDLVGVPPTVEELHAFLHDAAPDAYENVVDHLLASPRYGERWGRHWMDVWRYSDWAGFGAEIRESQRHIWHWRDWIIESLNQDKGYDRMILEMLAGDELAPADPGTVRATGFVARNWYLFNRNTVLENTIEHTAKAFLAVTMNCARCHDHFFDPITQQEYYRFRAFFEPYDVRTDRRPGQPDVMKDGIAHVYDAQLSVPTYLFVRGNEKDPDKSRTLTPGVPAALGGAEIDIAAVNLPLAAYCPDKREFVVAEEVAAVNAAIAAARAGWDTARRRLAVAVAQAVGLQPLAPNARLAQVKNLADALAVADLRLAMTEGKARALRAAIAADRLEDAGKRDTPEWQKAATEAVKLQGRLAVLEARYNLAAARLSLPAQPPAKRAEEGKKIADAEKALAKAEADARMPPTTAYKKRAVKTYPPTSTGRRLALARWIADKQNPLTARVAMNHLWLRHFGKGIVPTEFDFGHNGRPASHPALLDWLAAEFMDRHWSMKAMHRLMVTSNAYRMDSNNDPVSAAVDADNRYLWRMNPRRMEAELVRDSVLHVAGQLDPAIGGPDLDENLGLTSRRRSVYFRHAAEKEVEFLALFDAANVTECYRRVESIIPQQALAMANSSLVLAQSRVLAGRLWQEVAGQQSRAATVSFISAAFERILGRPPAPQEQAECARFLSTQAALFRDPKKLTAFNAGVSCSVLPAADPQQRARENLVHVLMNHNEFVTVR